MKLTAILSTIGVAIASILGGLLLALLFICEFAVPALAIVAIVLLVRGCA